jgi:hypothetical protein
VRLRTAGAALALAPFAVVALVVGWRVGTPLLSYDDIYRALFAHEWARAPYFFTERLVWLPFPLMATGLAVRVTGEVFWTALAVDLAASAVAIWFVYRLTEERFGALAAWVAAGLFGLTPWVVFLALSRYGEPVLLAAVAIGAHHWLRFADRGGGRALMWASLALTAAALSRYEAWPLAAAFAVHVAATAWSSRARAPARSAARPGWSVAWAALPLVAMGIWVAKNLAVYGHPVYGGALGFLPAAAPPGVWGGARLAALYLWQLNPIAAVLGLVGVVLHCRRAPLLAWLAALGGTVPWYTVSLFPVDVALQVRLMLLPLMLLAPFAGAVVARTVRPRLVAAALGGALVLVQLALDLRLEYPSGPLPMTLLARQLVRSGDLDRFDALYVQSAGPRGHPDEVRVATNFRRAVGVLPLDPAPAPWPAPSGRAILVLNDGRIPPNGGDGKAFVVSRVGPMTAWGICAGPPDRSDRVEWLTARAPGAARAGAPVTIDVTLRNAGSSPWPSNACGLALRLRWLRDGDHRAGDEIRVPLPARIASGGTAALAIPVIAPSFEGRYTLELSLGARESVRRFDVQVTAR